MILFLTILLTLFGVFFVSLGLLFINYDLSPLKAIVPREDVFYRPQLGMQVVMPGIVLFFLAFYIFSSQM